MYQKDFDSQKISTFVNIENTFKSEKNLEDIANYLIESTFEDYDILKKDTLDRFLDFIFFKVKSGYPYIINLAYPTQRIANSDLEAKIMKVLNNYLLPDIIFRLLKYITRNIQNSDTNLYFAQLITNEAIIKAFYDTFKMFRKDIAVEDPQKRTLSVKSIQQFPSKTEDKFSSPLDAACRLKYILEYIAIKQDTSHIYKKEDLFLSKYKQKF